MQACLCPCAHNPNMRTPCTRMQRHAHPPCMCACSRAVCSSCLRRCRTPMGEASSACVRIAATRECWRSGSKVVSDAGPLQWWCMHACACVCARVCKGVCARKRAYVCVCTLYVCACARTWAHRCIGAACGARQGAP